MPISAKHFNLILTQKEAGIRMNSFIYSLKKTFKQVLLCARHCGECQRLKKKKVSHTQGLASRKHWKFQFSGGTSYRNLLLQQTWSEGLGLDDESHREHHSFGSHKGFSFQLDSLHRLLHCIYCLLDPFLKIPYTFAVGWTTSRYHISENRLWKGRRGQAPNKWDISLVLLFTP